jgi:putative iron-only hydrogenase system regulator
MDSQICVVGLLVEDRACHGPEVQEILTRHGSHIVMRSGIPDPGRERGIITLVTQSDDAQLAKLEGDLQGVHGVTVKSAVLGKTLE